MVTGPDALLLEEVRKSICAFVCLAEREAMRAEHEGFAVGHRVNDVFPQVGEVEFHVEPVQRNPKSQPRSSRYSRKIVFPTRSMCTSSGPSTIR